VFTAESSSEQEARDCLLSLNVSMTTVVPLMIPSSLKDEDDEELRSAIETSNYTFRADLSSTTSEITLRD